MIDTVYSLFENIVAKHKGETAIIENDRTVTFGELSNLADIIAGSFPKEITSIGIVMSHRAEMVASILAVLKCGARYIPAQQDGRRVFVLRTAISATMYGHLKMNFIRRQEMSCFNTLYALLTFLWRRYLRAC